MSNKSMAENFYGPKLKDRSFQISGLNPEPSECSGEEFVKANGDNLSVLEYGHVAGLLVGETATLGGGAGPAVEIRRLA